MKKYPKELIIGFYRQMLRIRICEESLVGPILKGEVRCPVHLCSGQEAIPVGLCAALAKKDYIFGTHRSHGHFLAKGGRLTSLLAEMYGKNKGCSSGRGGSMHICDPQKNMLGAAPIVGGTISLALGAALASWIRKDKRVTVSFFGDGATGEGVLYESLNFAALKKLSVIFACENNLYSTHMPISECRAKNNIFKIGVPFGVTSFRIDGNDVLKVYEASKKAADICRKGAGPVFLEFMTYRLRGHVGPDDNIQGEHTDIRPKAEITKWKKKDPLPRLEGYLIKYKILDARGIEKIKIRVINEVGGAFSFVKKSAFPKRHELNRHVFKE